MNTMKLMIATSGMIAVLLFVGLLAFEWTTQQRLASLSLADRQIAVGEENCGNETAASTPQCTPADGMGCGVDMASKSGSCANGHSDNYDYYSGCKPDHDTKRTACGNTNGAALGDEVESGGYELKDSTDPKPCGERDDTACATPDRQRVVFCSEAGCFLKVFIDGNGCVPPDTTEKSDCPGTLKVAHAADC
jgi:hypothetical protein